MIIQHLQSQLEEKKELQYELKNVNKHTRNLASDLVDITRNQQILLKQIQDGVLKLEEPKEENLFKRLFKK